MQLERELDDRNMTAGCNASSINLCADRIMMHQCMTMESYLRGLGPGLDRKTLEVAYQTKSQTSRACVCPMRGCLPVAWLYNSTSRVPYMHVDFHV